MSRTRSIRALCVAMVALEVCAIGRKRKDEALAPKSEFDFKDLTRSYRDLLGYVWAWLCECVPATAEDKAWLEGLDFATVTRVCNLCYGARVTGARESARLWNPRRRAAV